MNPLSSKPRAPAEHPVMAHAKIWQHVNAMSPDDAAAKTTELTHVLPIMGALASNPKVTRKDVIKAAADAAGAGHIQPSQAVQFISQMPQDDDKLQAWLKNAYATNLTALVHLKAAQQPMPQPTAPPSTDTSPQGVLPQ
jgi:hypothetical protein